MDMPAEEADDLLTPPDPFQAVRDQAEAEAVRLRALTDAQEYERREALADLGTRLDVLARDLPAATSWSGSATWSGTWPRTAWPRPTWTRSGSAPWRCWTSSRAPGRGERVEGVLEAIT
jgi:hypothetical protein